MQRRVLVVFVDALGASQAARLNEYLSLPHTRSINGVLGYSTGALPTVLTGAPPDVHGRMCLFAHRGSTPSILSGLRWLGLLPRWLHERSRVRRLAEAWLRRRHGLTGYVALHRVPPALMEWLDVPEREDLFQAEQIGGQTTFLSEARAAGLTVYAAPWQLPEPERWSAVHAQLGATPPDLTFLYSTALDGAMHRSGTNAPSLDGIFREVAAHIARARDTLAQGGADVTTIIVGDHGMADVTSVIDPRPVLSRLETRVFVDSTMLRCWGAPTQLDALQRRLESSWPGRWIDRDAMIARRSPTRGFGDALWLLPEGALFAPSFLGGRIAGMHGYDLNSSSARAGLITDRAFSADSLTDIAGLVRQSLALTKESTCTSYGSTNALPPAAVPSATFTRQRSDLPNVG